MHCNLQQVGIDTGVVKADLHPAIARITYRGRVMNRAARINSLAATGQVWASADAWSRAAGEINTGVDDVANKVVAPARVASIPESNDGVDITSISFNVASGIGATTRPQTPGSEERSVTFVEPSPATAELVGRCARVHHPLAPGGGVLGGGDEGAATTDGNKADEHSRPSVGSNKQDQRSSECTLRPSLHSPGSGLHLPVVPTLGPSRSCAAADYDRLSPEGCSLAQLQKNLASCRSEQLFGKRLDRAVSGDGSRLHAVDVPRSSRGSAGISEAGGRSSAAAGAAGASGPVRRCETQGFFDDEELDCSGQQVVGLPLGPHKLKGVQEEVEIINCRCVL